MRRSVVLTFTAALVAMILAAPAASWTWPADGQVIRAFSLGDDPYAGGQHRGVDIAADTGSGVRAPSAGTVSFAGTVPGNGRTVTIRTDDGYAVTLVGLGSIGVTKNALVSEGETVGTVAPAPDEATPSNVHLGIRIASDPDGYLDPLTLLPARAEEPTASDQTGDEAAPATPDENVPVTDDETEATSEPEASDQTGGEAAPATPEESVPVTDDEAEGSSEPEADATASDDSNLDVADTTELTDGAIAEVAPATSSVEQSSESVTPALSEAPGNSTTLARSGASVDVPVEQQVELPRPSSAPGDESSSSSDRASSRGTSAGSSVPNEAEATTAARTAQFEQRRNAAGTGSDSTVAHARSVDSRWILLPALLLLLLGATGGSVLVAARVRGSRRPPRMMLSPEGDAANDEREPDSEKDLGSGGLAVCQRPAPYWARRRVRRPVRHLRALPPAQRQRRADGEWHRRARDARYGRGRERRALIS